MKKKIAWILLALFLFVSATPAFAATDIKIHIDGQRIVSDVKPEIKNNRVMVPVRVISEHLGAHVKYSNSKISISKGDLRLTLSLNSAVAELNGKKVQLDAKAYAKHNRTYVPLRFIAEAFDCQVGYGNHTVTVNTSPLVIEGKAIKTLQWEYRMTMGGVVQQSTGNIYNKDIFHLISDHIGTEIEAPENYSWSYFMDTPGAYYKNVQYEFLDASAAQAARYDVYSLIHAFPDELLEGYPQTVLHDVINDKWYLFDNDVLEEVGDLLYKAEEYGYVKEISNTVA